MFYDNGTLKRRYTFSLPPSRSPPPLVAHVSSTVWMWMWMNREMAMAMAMASVARLEIANLRVFILMSFYFDFNASPKCVRRFLIFSSGFRLVFVLIVIAIVIVIDSPSRYKAVRFVELIREQAKINLRIHWPPIASFLLCCSSLWSRTTTAISCACRGSC